VQTVSEGQLGSACIAGKFVIEGQLVKAWIAR
jgi:hypothetical protein